MSIATRTGDGGDTSLLYNVRVMKCHSRIIAVGCVDALNVALGAVRVNLDPVSNINLDIKIIQGNLISLMGELGCHEAHNQRYLDSTFSRITPEDLLFLDQGVTRIEVRNLKFDGWSTPGTNILEISLEQARIAARAAERTMVLLGPSKIRAILLQYINRLSDLLWLMAQESKLSS